MFITNSRLLHIFAVILLIISVLIIIQFGIPVIVAQSTVLPQVVQASSPTSRPTATSIPTSAPTQAVTATFVPSPQPIVRPTVAPVVTADPLFVALVTLINQQRHIIGTPALTLDDRLSAAARNGSSFNATGDLLTQDQIKTVVQQTGYYYKALWTSSASSASTDAQTLFNTLWADAQARQELLSADYSDIGLGSQPNPAGANYYLLVLAAPVALTAPSADINQPGEPTQLGQAQAILALLNAARTAAGSKILTLNDKLTAAALTHSQDQAQMDTMTHTGSDGSQASDRATAAGYAWSLVGENVLSRLDIHAAGAFDQWWNSPPHHENMMNPAYTEIGLAYAASKTGQVYYTMVLGAPQ